MRKLWTSELDLIHGGLLPGPPGSGSENHISGQVTEGLSPTMAEQLIGYIEAFGAFADPLTAIDSDVGMRAFNAVEQSILIPRMQIHCEADLGEQWRPGPARSLGYCEAPSGN